MKDKGCREDLNRMISRVRNLEATIGLEDTSGPIQYPLEKTGVARSLLANRLAETISGGMGPLGCAIGDKINKEIKTKVPTMLQLTNTVEGIVNNHLREMVEKEVAKALAGMQVMQPVYMTACGTPVAQKSADFKTYDEIELLKEAFARKDVEWDDVLRVAKLINKLEAKK